ncbi:MAG: C40 family peptidase [Pseudomonadota bacterium]
MSARFAFLLVLMILPGCSWDTPAPQRDESEAVRTTPPSQPPQRTIRTARRPDPTVMTAGDRAAAAARSQLGTPYRYGGRGPDGFDCSGLVQFAWARAGVTLPRTTAQQWQSLTPVPIGEARVGDLVFFQVDGRPGHVGLYVGSGQFVHAPATGQQVRIQSLSSPWYRERLLRAGRPTNR